MATTNIPTEMPAAAAAGEGDAPDLDAQARAAVEDRAGAFFDSTAAGARIRLNEELKNVDDETRRRRTEDFQHNVDQMRQKAIDDAMAIYEDAIQRRGPHQAAMDQLQGAVGLPADPKRRQVEIEKRTAQGDAAMSAQSGVGTVPDNLEGRLLGTRIDEYFGDPGRAEFNPHVQEGHGQNIAQMAQASHRLQQIAPGAPMTQENVNDPHGALERMQADRQQQALDPDGKPPTGDTPGDPNVSMPPPNVANTEDIKPDAQGLTEEQLKERDRIAAGGDPS